MSKQSDESAAEGAEGAEIKTYTQEEVDALLAQHGIVDVSDRPPGHEEGPHLQDPENRRLKRKQLRAYGWTAETEDLTDDEREILSEPDEDE